MENLIHFVLGLYEALPSFWIIWNIAGWLWLPILLFLFLFYYFIVLPMNWVKDLSSVGFVHVSKKQKIMEVNNLRKLRKVGQLPPIYPNGWFVLLEGPSLARGQAVSVNALGENFVVFRSSTDGQVHVLDAYCPHLGANLGIGGAVRGDCIECPFHGWQFRGTDGQCTSIPYSKKVPDFAKIKRWISCEVNHLIFVWYHAENDEPHWFPESRPEIESGQWMYRGRNEFLINCHVQEIPENGGDVAHLNILHAPSTFNGSDLRKTTQMLGSYQPLLHTWEANWQPLDTPDRKHESRLDLTHSIQVMGKYKILSMNIEARQIGPGYVILDLKSNFGPFTILQYVTPVEPLLQKVVHRIYCPWRGSLCATFLLIAESIMIERDIMVWNHKKYLDKPLLVKEDKALARHRRWYNQFYSENSPRMSFTKENLDW